MPKKPDGMEVWNLPPAAQFEGPITLSPKGRIWVKGWLAPWVPSDMYIRGVELLVNGKTASVPAGHAMVPDNLFDLCGAIGVITTELKSPEQRLADICNEIYKILANEFDSQIEKIDKDRYEKYIKPKLMVSDRCRQLLLSSAKYTEAFGRFHEFETNQGLFTPESLLADLGLTGKMVFASSTINVHHRVFESQFSKNRLVSCPDPARYVLQEFILSHGGQIQFVDEGLSQFWLNATRDKGKHADEQWIIEFFHRAFNDDDPECRSHKGTKVMLWDENSGPISAILIRSGMPTSSHGHGGDTRHFATNIFHSSTFLISPRSRLAGFILGLNRSDDPETKRAQRPVAIAVHNLAVLFTVGVFSSHFAELQWDHVANLVAHFQASERKRDELQTQLADNRHLRRDNKLLKHRLKEAQRELEGAREELRLYKNMLGL